MAELTIDGLQREVEFYRAQCWAPSTRRAYGVHRRTYLAFCNSIGMPPVPATTNLLCMYAAFLARKLCFKSIKQYLNIVRILHLEWDLPSPLVDNFHLHSTLQGIKRHKGDATRRKAPMTPQMLLVLQSRLDLSKAEDAAIWAAALVMFFSLLRRSNVLPSSPSSFDTLKHLRQRDLTFTTQGLVLKVRWSKTIQFRDRELNIPLCRLRHHPLCPTTAMFLALSFTPAAPPDGPALVLPSGSSYRPLTAGRFVEVVQHKLRQAGITQDIGGHSFRRGGATWAYNSGVAIDTIRQLGDWRSNAYTAYTICDTATLRQAEELMSSALPSS